MDMPDVEEVTKERQYSGVMDSSKSGYSLSKNENEVKFSLVPKGRYKGFYNLAILDERRFRIGTENEDTEVKFEISTSHGVMFNPYLFLGIGFSFHYYLSDDEEDVLDYESLELPLYLHLRSHIINKKTAPFVDLRFG